MSLVCFRVDGDSQIGLGHLMRCLALAQALEQQQIQCLFLIKGETADFCKSRHDWVGHYKLLPDKITFEQENHWLRLQLQQLNPWALVLDGYQFNANYRAGLKQCPVPLVVFDDNNNSGQLYADMVLNASSNANSLGYEKTAAKALLCLGDHYRILRQEFIQRSLVEWKQRNSLTLIFGGSDVLGLTLPLLQALEQRQIDFPIRVITGAAYQESKELRKFIQQSCLTIQHLPDCQQVAEVFSYSKFVVSAAGGSQFELLACETPSILVVVAANQLNATQEAAKQGWCSYIDFTSEKKIAELADSICILWQDDNSLKYMHQKAKHLVDLGGADRVVQAISNLRSKI